MDDLGVPLFSETSISTVTHKKPMKTHAPPGGPYIRYAPPSFPQESVNLNKTNHSFRCRYLLGSRQRGIFTCMYCKNRPWWRYTYIWLIYHIHGWYMGMGKSFFFPVIWLQNVFFPFMGKYSIRGSYDILWCRKSSFSCSFLWLLFGTRGDERSPLMIFVYPKQTTLVAAGVKLTSRENRWRWLQPFDKCV